MNEGIPESMQSLIEKVKAHYQDNPKIGRMFEKAFKNTYETTIREDGDKTFVITGDIPAMWLRDSAAQVRPYLVLAEKDLTFARLVAGVVRQQFEFIKHDVYANAFNQEPNGERYHDDETEMTDWMWERKYEIDSLCYPIQLAYLYWKSTTKTDVFNDVFVEAVRKIIKTWKVEQHHEEQSAYYFKRDNCSAQDTLSHEGKGASVQYTGMTWSGFRPSDDACQYGYLIPSNMFAVVVLGYLAEIAEAVLSDSELKEEALNLAHEIDEGIKKFGVVHHPKHGVIYAYETDGYGRHVLMDDANVPSLLSIPYLGYTDITDSIYQNTRRFLLSKDNPYYYEGTIAKGIGSPHTPSSYIWHIALAIQGMTAIDEIERERLLEVFKETDAGTELMHEGFHVDNPSQFTRPWFSWANMMFSEFLLMEMGVIVKDSPLAKQKGSM
ncbi:glycoside hydrolase family 125 protein [Amphibacillus jilinensis]|uniref:glycoside hydrolase family 125 protein n=1 Tax=Amphibacillus jilinensis TaxID=1216008 RepID=UPI00030C1E0D|nr:glycoside hydrolase family 125 protein [Amphibacillus jilinensis]